ncbi:dephospho-CoA kinase [Phocaeicola sp.]
MIKIAVTGGIGSGKSYISHLLEEMNIPVYNADVEAKRLTSTDPGIRRELVALLGEEVYQDGMLNKPFLASYLFSDPEHVKQINAIIHPRVKEDFARWVLSLNDCEVAGMESAILYEAGFEHTVDAVVMVYAPLELRVERAMKRDNATEQQVRARMAAQLDDEEKRRRADFTVLNDGSQPLIPQLNNVIEQLKSGKFIQ